jgi:hypothetical protein
MQRARFSQIANTFNIGRLDSNLRRIAALSCASLENETPQSHIDGQRHRAYWHRGHSDRGLISISGRR